MSFVVGFGDSLAQGSEELWRSQNSCLSGSDFWCFIWPKVPKNCGISEIRVFLHPDMLEFCSVGELSCWVCELEIECQISYPSVTGKVQNLQRKYTYFWAILAYVIHALSESESFACWGQGRKCTCT